MAMYPLAQLLHSYRTAALTEREKGTYFESLTLAYLRHEATYADLYETVWSYADNLSKELPRIPAVKGADAFWAFSRAGRQLADLHLNYESVKPHPVTLDTGKLPPDKLPPEHYRVTKMRFGKVKDPESGKSIADKTTIIYNPHITLRDIPLEAYTYIVNGKPAIEWVMERQSVTTDKDSKITNDANDYAIETLQNPKYPLELLQRIIAVSLETMKVVDGLPGLKL